jgi:nitrogen regulatory protein PII
VKLLTAIIRPQALDDVRQALQLIGVKGLTVTEVRGYGRQGGHTEMYRGAEYKTEFNAKLKIDLALSDEMTPAVIDAINDATQTGRAGDGKIFVVDLEQVVRLRTGEVGEQAL